MPVLDGGLAILTRLLITSKTCWAAFCRFAGYFFPSLPILVSGGPFGPREFRARITRIFGNTKLGSDSPIAHARIFGDRLHGESASGNVRRSAVERQST